MFRVISARLHQGHRTAPYPEKEPALPDRFRGAPEIDAAKCAPGCRACAEVCPTGAIEWPNATAPQIDLGRCLFCTDCTAACPASALRHTQDYKLAASSRQDLVITPGQTHKLASALSAEMQRVLGRSLKLRQVSAGGCNACEADTNVLTTLVFDLGRFGIQFVASPRHADGMLVTGPIPANMRLAVEKTWAAIPAPKIVIAAGSCAISGGPYAGHPEVSQGLGSMMPVDLFIPGCPPHPYTILDGLLRLIARIR